MKEETMRLSGARCALTCCVVGLHLPGVVSADEVWTWPDSGVGGASGYVQCFRVWNDGSGTSLFVGGLFNTAGGKQIKNVARWDGQDWMDLAGGTSQEVSALVLFNDGSGEALYAGGGFISAGGVPVVNIAKWDGRKWAAVGTNLFSPPWALAVFDDGSGQALYAAGGGYVAKWGGTEWSYIFPNPLQDGGVRSLAVLKTSSGELLYAGGLRAADPFVVGWDGKNWIETPPLTGDSVRGMIGFDDGSGAKLFVGGEILSAGGVPTNGVAIWNGTSWSKADAGLGTGFVSVKAFDTVETVGGKSLYAFGPMSQGVAARWTGNGWEVLKSETCCQGVLTGVVFDDATGPRLHVGGTIGLEGKYKNIARTKSVVGGIQPCGDLTGDGLVNQQDLGILLGDFGCTKGPGLCPGDCDKDGDTDQADLGILLANWEKPCP